MAQLNPLDTTPNRVYIENLHYGVSRQTLVRTIVDNTGVEDFQMKIIRKPSGKGGQICSAIIVCPSEEAMHHMIAGLNSVPPIYLQHILSPGCISLNAKQAYIPGTRLLLHPPPTVPPPPSSPFAFPPPPPPHFASPPPQPSVGIATPSVKAVPKQPSHPPPASLLKKEPAKPTCAE